MSNYPITVGRRLEKPEKRRVFSRRAVRSEADLLKPDAHHMLVYRIDGNYVLDSDRMRVSDERVTQATHVSMVDMRRDAPVVVRMEIPTQDAATFEVLVTFTCSVTDPIAVVRGGVNAEQALWGHLKSHNRIFELGLDFPLTAVNQVRRVVSAQVKAFLTVRPPSVPGMTVSVAGVEVSNPEIWTRHKATQRSRSFEHQLAEEEQVYEHRLKTGSIFNGHELETEQQEHEINEKDRALEAEQVYVSKKGNHERAETRSQVDFDRELSVGQADHDRALAWANAEQERQLAAAKADFAREQLVLNMELIGENPRAALAAAFAANRIDATEYSNQLRALDDQDRRATIEEAQRKIDQRLQLEAAEREGRRYEDEQNREREAAEREEKARRHNQQRADLLRKEAEKRADRLRESEERREDRRRKDEARRAERQRQEAADLEERKQQVDLLKTMAAQGHFNTADLGGERLLAKVMNLPDPVAESTSSPALTTAAEVPRQRDDEEYEDSDVRDENV